MRLTRSNLAALALLGAVAMGCSSSSNSATPSPASSSPAPTPTFTQLGKLAVSEVLKTRSYAGGCPPASQSFPGVVIGAGEARACDPGAHKVYLLAPPVVNERDIEATTIAQEPGGSSWTVYLQLSKSGARSFGTLGGPYTIVYNGTVVNRPSAPSVTPGGLLQIQGLSKHKAQRIAAALNPS